MDGIPIIKKINYINKMKFTSKQKQNLLKWFNKKQYEKIVDFYIVNDLSYCLDLPFTRTNISFVESLTKCQQCGRCCTSLTCKGKISHISLIDNEPKHIAKEVGLKEKTFKENYCKEIKGRWFLKHPCHFHAKYDTEINQECKIYRSRPTSCRMFPLQNPKKLEYKGMPYMAITISPHCPAVKSFLIKQWLPQIIMYKKLIEEELRKQKLWIQQQKKSK